MIRREEYKVWSQIYTYPFPDWRPWRAAVTCRLLGDANTFPQTAADNILFSKNLIDKRKEMSRYFDGWEVEDGGPFTNKRGVTGFMA